MANDPQDRKTARIESEALAQDSNRDRISFLRTELQTCFTFAEMAETEQGMHNPEHAAKSLAEGEKGYATLSQFMSDPKHAKHLTAEERAELRSGMDRLRARLDKLAGK